jgi:hypothetical protein
MLSEDVPQLENDKDDAPAIVVAVENITEPTPKGAWCARATAVAAAAKLKAPIQEAK